MTNAEARKLAPRVPAECWPLGHFLREEMDERGWGINDVVARMGGDPQVSEMVLRMTLTIEDPDLLLDDETASGLSRAFDVSNEYFINLDKAWRDWCKSTRLGQEDVMDQDVATERAVNEYIVRYCESLRHHAEKHAEAIFFHRNHLAKHIAHVVKKLRAVTPASSAYALGSIKREEFLACFRLPALTVEDAEASLDEILALMSLHVRVVTPAVTLPTQPPKTISRGGIGWSHDDDPLVK